MFLQTIYLHLRGTKDLIQISALRMRYRQE